MLQKKISYELDYTKKSLFEKPLEEVVENFYDKDIKNFQKVIELIKKIRFEISNRFSQKFSLEINSIQKINWLDDNKELIVSIFKFEKFKYNPEDSIKKNSFVVGGVKFTLISDVENSNNQDKIVEQINFFKKRNFIF